MSKFSTLRRSETRCTMPHWLSESLPPRHSAAMTSSSKRSRGMSVMTQVYTIVVTSNKSYYMWQFQFPYFCRPVYSQKSGHSHHLYTCRIAHSVQNEILARNLNVPNIYFMLMIVNGAFVKMTRHKNLRQRGLDILTLFERNRPMGFPRQFLLSPMALLS